MRKGHIRPCGPSAVWWELRYNWNEIDLNLRMLGQNCAATIFAGSNFVGSILLDKFCADEVSFYQNILGSSRLRFMV
jgi:hypothetical protein